MAGYSPSDNLVLNSTGTVVSGVVTDTVVSKNFPITEGGSLHSVYKITVTGTTVAGAITAKLQTAIDGDWVDSKTASITADGTYYITFMAEVSADQTYLPLLSKGRIVVTTTDPGDTTTFSVIKSLQAL